ncbi:MAG: ABC transporter transmembrane domain-containing protein, partial [Pseudomonadota bacterium]
MSRSSRKKEAIPHIANAKLLYLRLFRYAWKYKAYFLISILALIILSASNTGFLALIKQVTDEGFVKQSPDKIFQLPLMLFGLMAIRALSGFVSLYYMRWIARHVVEAIRNEAFTKLMLLPVSYFDAGSSSVTVSKLTYDTERLSVVSTRVALSVIRDALTAIGLLGYMLYLDWKLTLIFAIVTPLMALYLRKMTPKLRASAKRVQESMGDMTKAAEEAIAGQRIVKIFGAGEYEFNRFSKIVGNNRHIELRLTRISGLNSLVIELLAATALGLVVYYAMGRFTAGEFAAFVGALLMLITPIKHLTAANEEFQIGLAAAQSVFDVIDSPT